MRTSIVTLSRRACLRHPFESVVLDLLDPDYLALLNGSRYSQLNNYACRGTEESQYVKIPINGPTSQSSGRYYLYYELKFIKQY